MPGYRQYLGDGLYVDFDGTQVVLSAENGIGATNTVYLEPGVFEELKRWHARQIQPLFEEG